jgi:CheY-like chemotaxis protein
MMSLMSLSKARKLKILVVDDLLDSAQSLALLLGEMGYEAKFEIRPETVLERARTLKPDAIFLDLGMPDIDGFRLAELLRAEFGESIRLVAITGYGADEDRKRTRKAGFDAHVLKPIDLPLLESILATVLLDPRRAPLR